MTSRESVNGPIAIVPAEIDAVAPILKPPLDHLAADMKYGARRPAAGLERFADARLRKTTAVPSHRSKIK